MTFRVLVVCILSIAASVARAQGFPSDSSHHFRLTLLLGGGSIASYDNVGSPLPYSGVTLPIGGEIEYVTPNVRHLFSVTGITSLGNAANLTDRYSNNAEDYQNVAYGYADLRYRFTHYLTDIRSTGIHVSIGGELDNFVFARAYNYLTNFNVSSGSGEGSSSIAAAADFTCEYENDHRFRASVSLPLLALVVRPGYGFINGNSSIFTYAAEGIKLQQELEPIGTMWSWRIGFDYDYTLSSVFFLGFHFQEIYYRYPVLLWRAVGAENDLTISGTWRFNL